MGRAAEETNGREEIRWSDALGPSHQGRLWCLLQATGRATELLVRGLLSSSILPRSTGRLEGKEGVSRRTQISGATAPGRGKAWLGGLGQGELLPFVLSPPCLFPLLLSLLSLSIPQVRSSLGTNILSATAAFAGTAILLMDFGVTNWVCFQTPPAVGRCGEW